MNQQNLNTSSFPSIPTKTNRREGLGRREKGERWDWAVRMSHLLQY